MCQRDSRFFKTRTRPWCDCRSKESKISCWRTGLSLIVIEGTTKRVLRLLLRWVGLPRIKIHIIVEVSIKVVEGTPAGCGGGETWEPILSSCTSTTREIWYTLTLPLTLTTKIKPVVIIIVLTENRRATSITVTFTAPISVSVTVPISNAFSVKRERGGRL